MAEVRAVDTRSPVTMTALKILSLIGKIAGLVTALETIPFVDPQTGVLIFAAASLLKDTANRIGDLVDDGRKIPPNTKPPEHRRCARSPEG